MRTRLAASAAAVVSLLGALSLGPPPATAGQFQPQVVSANPADFTPHVLDGEVWSVAQVGSKMVLGGAYTRAQNASGGAILTRNRILAFNRTTGVLDTVFNPNANGTVRAVVPAADSQSVYAGGQFTAIGGAGINRLARLNINTGLPVPGFSANVNNVVWDLKLVNNRLFVAGAFTAINGVSRQGLAELDPATGAVRNTVNVPFTGTHNGSSMHIRAIGITPNVDRLVAAGNFSTVGGLPRNQVAVLDLSGPTATVANWQTSRYVPICNGFPYYVYDMDISPDGTYFVVGTSGAFGGTSLLCDTAARWETFATGSNLQPSWIDFTGGDSLYSVEVAGTAIYVGGHQRWENNPFGHDSLGQGGVSREGIAALDPVNGMPVSWNPGRTRGRGVFDFLATADGLWVGSDTDRIGGGEFHARIAFFPLAGGSAVPQPSPPTLPVDVHLLGVSGDQSFRRPYDGTTVGATTPLPGGVAWGNVRGSFWLNGQLYSTWSNGTMTRRTYNGTTFGPPTTINLNGLTNFVTDMQGMSGLFYEQGRMYFTKVNETNLYMRYFTVEGGSIVGSLRTTIVGNITGVDWRNVNGMFLANNRLYWAHRTTGDLHRVNWQPGSANGVPVGGTDVIVDTANDWRARALFSYPGTGVGNQPPVASFTSSCSALACTFDGTGSSDPDGTIASYSWTFGDGGSGSGPTPSHTYATGGTYTVTLTVTDNDGAPDQHAAPVTVSAGGGGDDIEFVGSAADAVAGSSQGHVLNIPPSVQTGDAMVLALSWNSGTVTASDPAGWTRVRTQAGGQISTALWTRIAQAGDAGDPVTVNTSAIVRGSLLLSTYRNATIAAADTAITAETITRAAHTTPTVAGADADSWVVSHWADKTASTTSWTAPGGQIVRLTGAETGAGHMSWLLTDSGTGVPAGMVGGLTATANSATVNATMATVVLTPTG